MGLLCSAGVILAVLDPSLTGRSSSAAGTGIPYSAEQDDDGFVAPPSPSAEREAGQSARTTEPESDEEPDADALAAQAEQAARLALADAQIAKRLETLRKEREARTAAKHAARKHAARKHAARKHARR